jgi:ABC-type molybdate transport system permease subunit
MWKLRYYGRQKSFFSGTSGSLFKIGFFFWAMAVLIGVAAVAFPSVTHSINDGVNGLDHFLRGL